MVVAVSAAASRGSAAAVLVPGAGATRPSAAPPAVDTGSVNGLRVRRIPAEGWERHGREGNVRPWPLGRRSSAPRDDRLPFRFAVARPRGGPPSGAVTWRRGSTMAMVGRARWGGGVGWSGERSAGNRARFIHWAFRESIVAGSTQDRRCHGSRMARVSRSSPGNRRATSHRSPGSFQKTGGHTAAETNATAVVWQIRRRACNRPRPTPRSVGRRAAPGHTDSLCLSAPAMGGSHSPQAA
jgi:hypothetical protein